MIDVNKAVIAKLRKDGGDFEILVDCDKALEFREGKGDLDDVLATEDIFKDVKKGMHASEYELEKSFQTSDPKKVAEIIIKKGEIQLTKDHKNKLREEKRKRIIAIINKNTINPQTNLPNPPQRIESALEEANIHIDEFKKAEEQVQEVIDKIRRILPIKFEVREIAINIPAEFAARSYNMLKNFGKLLKDEWQNNGNLIAVIEIPAGMQEEVESELNKLTHGNTEIKILNKR